MTEIKKLGNDFYARSNVTRIAKELLGKIIVTQFNGNITSARIVETEAYAGITDRASHAYNNRNTNRTSVMFLAGGRAYVYLCYGIHHMFNIVTNVEGIPHAILVRAAEPLEGIDAMLKRTGKRKADFTLTRGPGNVAKALGLFTKHTGTLLNSEEVYIADDGFRLPKKLLGISARIGVAYAKEDASLPYRFFVKHNLYVSGTALQNGYRSIEKK